MNTILIYILIASTIITLGWLVSLELRLRRVFGGKRANELEQVLADVQKELAATTSTHDTIKRRLVQAEKRLATSIRNIKTTRFNPFADSGSNQSFATALIDDHGDGVVLSSLYSRERVSVFAKPIEKGTSKYDLTEEEAEVLATAYSHEQ